MLWGFSISLKNPERPYSPRQRRPILQEQDDISVATRPPKLPQPSQKKTSQRHDKILSIASIRGGVVAKVVILWPWCPRFWRAGLREGHAAYDFAHIHAIHVCHYVLCVSINIWDTDLCTFVCVADRYLNATRCEQKLLHIRMPFVYLHLLCIYMYVLYEAPPKIYCINSGVIDSILKKALLHFAKFGTIFDPSLLNWSLNNLTVTHKYCTYRIEIRFSSRSTTTLQCAQSFADAYY